MKSIVYIAYACFLAAAMSGCGGGGGGNSSSQTADGVTVISGIVSDDPISGATVNAVSTDTGIPLGDPVVTGTDGSYTLTAKTNAIGSGYRLTSTGGTMLGQPFLGTLSAIYRLGRSATQPQSNLTLITTALVEAAQATTQFSGNALGKFEAVVTDGIARGLIGADYYLVEPAGNQMAALRTLVASQGVTATVAQLSQNLTNRPVPNGCTATDTECVRDVYATSGDVSITLQGGATISARQGALDNCRIVASYGVAEQTLKMRIENSDPRGSTSQTYACAQTGTVSISLAAITSQAPGDCPDNNQTPSMQNCVTIFAGLTPSFSVKDGGKHRSIHASHTAALPLAGEISITRDYGATLYASLPESDAWTGKDAVIFVHGFTPCLVGGYGNCFGGDEGTWLNLPGLVTENSANVAINFQWRTDASYLSVANQLAEAVDYAYQKTGRKVHIIAHSFGGVLARVMLQNLNGFIGPGYAAEKVRTLTTVGTPHSGIVDNVNSQTGVLPVEGINLPKGWGSVPIDPICRQISCYQSGLNANIAKWAKDELRENQNNQPPAYGYITARLKATQSQLPRDLKILVLIGQIFKNTLEGTKFNSDDGLITYLGQRFNPSPGRNALLVDALIPNSQGVKVTERILGMAPTVDAFPDDLLADAMGGASSYSTSPASPSFITSSLGLAEYLAWKGGYKHSSFGAILATGGADTLAPNSEVAIPANCGNAADCQHDTWVNIKQFLEENKCVPPQVLQGGACISPITVTSISPVSAMAGIPVALTVVGQNLPLTAVLSMADAVCQTPVNRTATGFNVTCTPGNLTGSKIITVSTNTPASLGVSIDASFSVNVVASSLSTVFSDDFDGTSLQSAYWTGSASITGGGASFACNGKISTNGKVSFAGNVIVVEGGSTASSGRFGSRTTRIRLTDATTPANIIEVGDTNYRAIDGLYAAGGGVFNLAQSGNGISTANYKEYRLTITGNTLVLERGDTLNNITETVSRTLASSIAGKVFYLDIGTGSTDYCPSSFNFVRVRTN